MNLIEKLPYFYENSIDTTIQNSLSLECETLHKEIEDTLSQFFVDDCTWGLEYWEKMLGIGKNNHDIITRRENIKARMRTRGTSTLEVIKNVCEAYSNGEVDIIQDYANYSFKIKFVSNIGMPRAFDELDRTVNEIKPCHLAHSYEFTFTTNSEIKKYTHKQLSSFTHSQIRQGGVE